MPFQGTESRVFDFFITQPDNLIIPEYQTEYRWEPEDVRQLFADISAGGPVKNFV